MRLTIRNLHHRFGDRVLFAGTSFDAASREMIALMGPSGAGKSTFLSFIAGATRPDGGTICLSQERAEVRLSWILQSTPLLPRRTGFANVVLGPLSDGAARADAAARAEAAMSKLGVSHTARKKVFCLSGGERQRLAVARAIACSADLILADEPTAALDPMARADVMDALRVAASEGAVVIVSTHDPVVSQRADRIVNIDGGVLVTGSNAHEEVPCG